MYKIRPGEEVVVTFLQIFCLESQKKYLCTASGWGRVVCVRMCGADKKEQSKFR